MIKLLKKTEIGILYFYIHFVTEIICFYVLNELFKLPVSAWLIALAYDALAFVPQSLLGNYRDIRKDTQLGIIGLALLFVSVLGLKLFDLNAFAVLILLCAGNVILHIEGAEATIRSSEGMMSPSSIFVGGGSFGVIVGKLCSLFKIHYSILLLLIISGVPFILLSNSLSKNINFSKKFKFANNNNKVLVIIYAALIVIIRGYMGYGIPTSWNKTIIQHIIFYFSMGLGKCLGGILIDYIGIRKTSYISILGSIPFLLFGDSNMWLSIIGVSFFSMTMAITLAILVSVLPNKVGLAFGITTICLFLGSVPVFFIKVKDFTTSAIMIISLSVLCMLMALRITKNEYSN